jgi:RNA polymerase sigma factor (sigma-70 family)
VGVAPLFASRFALDPERSFERLYRKHVRDVYAFSLGILGSPEDAEDVTQTTFMNAYRALARGDAIANPRAWLLKIAHNVCRQRFRTAARRPQEVELAYELAETFTEEDQPPAADEIRAALRHLAFNQRTVLVLREIEGLSYAEIADAMAVSTSAVETLLFRARRSLREQLEAAERPLACPEAEVYISRQLDRRLSRSERRQLRAHLRACPACAAYARSQRAQKKAMSALAAVPLPVGLAKALGTSAGGGLAAKAAAVAVGVAVVGSGVAVGTGVVAPFRDPPPAQAVPPGAATAAGAGEAAGRGTASLPPPASEVAEERSRRAEAWQHGRQTHAGLGRPDRVKPAKGPKEDRPAKPARPEHPATSQKGSPPATAKAPVTLPSVVPVPPAPPVTSDDGHPGASNATPPGHANKGKGRRK